MGSRQCWIGIIDFSKNRTENVDILYNILHLIDYLESKRRETETITKHIVLKRLFVDRGRYPKQFFIENEIEIPSNAEKSDTPNKKKT